MKSGDRAIFEKNGLGQAAFAQFHQDSSYPSAGHSAALWFPSENLPSNMP